MGFFKSLGNAVSNLAQGDLKGAVNDLGGAVGIGSGSTANNHDTAYNQVLTAAFIRFQTELGVKGLLGDAAKKKEAMSKAVAYCNSSEGKAAIAKIEGELNNGQSAQGGTVQTILAGVGAAVGGSVVKGAANFVDKGIAVLTDKALGTKTVKTLQEQIGTFFSGVGTEALKDFFKKYWPYFVGGIVGLYFLFRGKKRKGGKGGRGF
jgi:hypothetical protein